MGRKKKINIVPNVNNNFVSIPFWNLAIQDSFDAINSIPEIEELREKMIKEINSFCNKKINYLSEDSLEDHNSVLEEFLEELEKQEQSRNNR